MNYKKHSTIIILTLIVLIGFALRIYRLDSIPAILNRDEAALAYNAFLLKETGMDEWSRTWPLTLESFGDFKLPGYPTLLVVFFTLFGTNDFIVRLPSALAGSLLILVAFWWANNLGFPKKWGLITALTVALTPIFWFYSRIGFEANVALSLVLAATGLLLFYKKYTTDALALLLFLLASLTYNTPLLLIPFIVIVIPLRRGIKTWSNWLFPTSGLLLIFVSIFSQLFSLTSQKSSITIFSNETVWMDSVTYRQQFSGVSQSILGNKYIYFFQLMIARFLKSFSPIFLVTAGGSHPWHSLPNAGHITWLTYLAGIVGIFRSIIQLNIKRVMQFKESILLLYLLVIGLLPSIITVDAPHATRSLFFFFIFSLFAVKGMIYLEKKLPQSSRKLFFILLISSILISGVEFGNKYFLDYPANQPDSLYIGFDHVIVQADAEYPKQQIAIVDSEGYHYILTAWYLKTDPKLFQESIVKQLPNQIGFRYGERFDHFHFIGQQADVLNEDEKVFLYWSDDQWRIIKR